MDSTAPGPLPRKSNWFSKVSALAQGLGAVARASPATLLWPLLLFSLLCSVSVWTVSRAAHNEADDAKAHALSLAKDAAVEYQLLLSMAFSLTQVLVSLVQSDPQYDALDRLFNAAAPALASAAPMRCVRMLSLAPAAVIRQVYPLAGNEYLKNFDLFSDPAINFKRTISIADLSVEGPMPLLPGEDAGTRLVIRKAIHIPVTDPWDTFGRPDEPNPLCGAPCGYNATTGTKFWGGAAVLVDLDMLRIPIMGDRMVSAPLRTLAALGYRYALVAPGQPQYDNGGGGSLVGRATVVESSGGDPGQQLAVADVELGSGVQWTLLVGPPAGGGWMPLWYGGVVAAVVVASLIASLLLLWLLVSRRRHQMLLHSLLPADLIRDLQITENDRTPLEPKTRLDSETPADVLMGLLAALLAGLPPDLRDVVLLKTVLRRRLDVYRPINLRGQLRDANLDTDVASALMRQLGNPSDLRMSSSGGSRRSSGCSNGGGGDGGGGGGDRADVANAMNTSFENDVFTMTSYDLQLAEQEQLLVKNCQTVTGVLSYILQGAGDEPLAGMERGAATVGTSRRTTTQPSGAASGSKTTATVGDSYSTAGDADSVVAAAAMAAGGGGGGSGVRRPEEGEEVGRARPTSAFLLRPTRPRAAEANMAFAAAEDGRVVCRGSDSLTLAAAEAAGAAGATRGGDDVPGDAIAAAGPVGGGGDAAGGDVGGGGGGNLRCPASIDTSSLAAEEAVVLRGPQQQQRQEPPGQSELQQQDTVRPRPPPPPQQQRVETARPGSLFSKPTGPNRVFKWVSRGIASSLTAQLGVSGSRRRSTNGPVGQQSPYFNVAAVCSPATTLQQAGGGDDGIRATDEIVRRGAVAPCTALTSVDGVDMVVAATVMASAAVSATLSAPGGLRVSQLTSPPRPLVEDVERLLAQCDSWQFDTWGLQEASCGHALSALGFFIMQREGLVERFRLEPLKLARLLRTLESGYLASNPYHNSAHAADVLHTLHVLLHGARLTTHYLDPLGLLATYFAAIVHDYGHPGLTNDFLVATSHPLALRYNDRSPLECHHAAAAFTLLAERPDLDVTTSLNRTERTAFRKQVVELVLATDMKQHFAILNQFNTIHRLANLQASAAGGGGGSSGSPPLLHRSCGRSSQEPAAAVGAGRRLLGPPTNAAGCKPAPGAGLHTVVPPVPLDETERLLTLQIMLKASDIGHLGADLKRHKRWLSVLEEEFFRQGDQERQLGLPISPLFDRAKQGVGKSQVGFYDFVALPLIRAAAAAFPGAAPLLHCFKANYHHWRRTEAEATAAATAAAELTAAAATATTAAPAPAAAGATAAAAAQDVVGSPAAAGSSPRHP